MAWCVWGCVYGCVYSQHLKNESESPWLGVRVAARVGASFSGMPHVSSLHINSGLLSFTYLPGALKTSEFVTPASSTYLPIKHICQVVLQSLLEHSQGPGAESLLKFQAAFLVRKFTEIEQ